MYGVSILETAVGEVEAGRKIAVCVIVETQGSTPQPPGTMVCVDEGARLAGTLGGGCVEADVRRRAHQLLSAGRNEVISFNLDGAAGEESGMICGGDMAVAVNVLSPASNMAPYREALALLRAGHSADLPVYVPGKDGLVEYRVNIEASPEVVIAGAGHIARILAGMMVPLGFRVYVVDDRVDYANAERFPDPIEVIVGDIAGTLASRSIAANTYIVIVTRGHKHDEEALKAVLDSQACYIGMIGSRRKTRAIFDNLRHGGATEKQLSRVRSPIGLSINSVTAAEIALSIAAELVSVRRAEHRKAVEGPIRLQDTER